MNSILFFDPARDRWDTRRPDALRNRADPPSSISILTVTWTAPPSGGSGSTTSAECESQATRVDRIIRENNSPTIIALAGVPRAFIFQLLTQQSVRQGYAFSSLEGESGSCALLWRISFAVFFVEPKSKSFPCMLAHSRELFGAPAVISTAAFPGNSGGGGMSGSPEQLRELWEGYLGSVGQDTTAIAVCYVGSAANNSGGVAQLRSSLQPSPVDAVSDGPHAIWFRAADGRQITAQAGVPPLQNLGDRITQITLATLAGGQSPAPSNSQTPVPNSLLQFQQQQQQQTQTQTQTQSQLQQQQQQQQQQQNQAQAMSRNSSNTLGMPSTGTPGGMGAPTTSSNSSSPPSLLNPTGASSTGTQQQQQQQQQRLWILKNNCNIKVRENTVEILYDLSQCFARSEDCTRTLNNDNFRWNSDFAICHGRLFACSGARADLGSFQKWMREHDPPITHSQRAELIANKSRLNNLPAGNAGANFNAAFPQPSSPGVPSSNTNMSTSSGAVGSATGQLGGMGGPPLPPPPPAPSSQLVGGNLVGGSSGMASIGGGGGGTTAATNQLSPPNPNSVQQQMQQQQQQQTASQHLFGNVISSNNSGGMIGATNNSSSNTNAANIQHATGIISAQSPIGAGNSNSSGALLMMGGGGGGTGGGAGSGLQLPLGSSSSAVASISATASSGAAGSRFYRRGWSVSRAVLLHQVGPVELQAFDVTLELGVVPRPLPVLVDRLNGLSSTHSHTHPDQLATYTKDYALCYCAERRGYWLVAAPNVPCDPMIARAVALQLKKQKQQLQQQLQQQQLLLAV